ncbi:MAG: hypothetical protein A2014_08660 [Spirochaetes bacterium GWF1_49_6]|jgi:hypothetical protein|nr:MAG: hypothetical protein A2014_08660 [Spirochaetes bacterium GWF1_49_6]
MTAILFVILLLLIFSVLTTLFIIYVPFIPVISENHVDFLNPQPVNLDKIFSFHEAFYWPHIFWELAGRVILDGE